MLHKEYTAPSIEFQEENTIPSIHIFTLKLQALQKYLIYRLSLGPPFALYVRWARMPSGLKKVLTIQAQANIKKMAKLTVILLLIPAL